MKISAVLQLLVFLAFMLQTARSSSSLCHSINDDDKCMNAPIKELIQYRRKLDSKLLPDKGQLHHAALQGVLTEDSSCGIILLEKSTFKGECRYGKSRAVPWNELSSKVKKRFYQNGRKTANNVHKKTPGGLLTAMGPNYDLRTDNCQHAVKKAWTFWYWEFWYGFARKRREVDNSNITKLDCSPTPWGDDDSNNADSNNADSNNDDSNNDDSNNADSNNADSNNDDNNNDDSNNADSNNAEQYKISPFLFAIPAWSIVKVLLW